VEKISVLKRPTTKQFDENMDDDDGRRADDLFVIHLCHLSVIVRGFTFCLGVTRSSMELTDSTAPYIVGTVMYLEVIGLCLRMAGTRM
jgi:hypothetical protein